MNIGYIPCKTTNYDTSLRSNMDIKYIVLHYTANNGDTARGNGNYFAKNNTGTSAHYFVDDTEIVQSVEDNKTAYHCGGVRYYSDCRNRISIGVEMCSRKDSKGNYYFTDDTLNNCIKLVRYLMERYNIPIDNVIRHYDVTRKKCPAPFVDNEELYNNFKRRLTEKVDVYEAIRTLQEHGIITTVEYWQNAIKCVNYLDDLIINMAKNIKE